MLASVEMEKLAQLNLNPYFLSIIIVLKQYDVCISVCLNICLNLSPTDRMDQLANFFQFCLGQGKVFGKKNPGPLRR